MSQASRTPALTLRGCTVDLARGWVTRADGTRTRLTGREQTLLAYLVERPSESIERDALLAAVWNSSAHVVTRACDSAVSRLRAKIELDPAAPDHLITVHGVGYRFEPGGATHAVTPLPVEPSRVVHLGPLRVDLGRLRVDGVDGRSVALTDLEQRLLERLSRTAASVDRDDLATALGLRRAAGRVSGLVHRLRAKIEPDPKAPRYLIRTATGYRLDVPPVDAPPEVDGLVGRDAASAQLRAAATPGAVVTVLGPGGIGKTALARAFAREVEVVWVDAGVAVDAASLAARVSASLGAGSVDRIGPALAHRGAVTVVLDEVEGVVDEARAALARWRAAAPAARFVVTSRTRLGIDGERVLELGPLSHADAVELFVRRDPSVDPADPALHALVDHLERIPLAIGFAAARRSVLSLDAQRRTPLLELLADPRASGRQRSARDLFADGWASLEPGLRDTLAAASLFERFTAADLPNSLDHVQALRDRSWISAVAAIDGELVLGLLAPIRAFVEAQQMSPALRRAHVERLAAHGDPATLDRWNAELPSRSLARLRRLAPELVRAARLALTLGRPSDAARCAEAAALGSARDGGFDATLAVLREVHAALGPGVDRARLGFRIAATLDAVGRRPEGIDALTESRALAAAAGDRWLEARCLQFRSVFARSPEDAREGAALAERAGDSFLSAWCTHLAERLTGEAGLAPTLLRALEAATRAGNRRGTALVLESLAVLDHWRGALGAAAERFERALELLGDEVPVDTRLRLAGLSYLCRADLDDPPGGPTLDARAAELSAACVQAGLPERLAHVRYGLALRASANGQPERARSLALEALALRDGRPPIAGLEVLLVQLELDLGRPADAIARAVSVAAHPFDDLDRITGEALRAVAEARLGQVAAARARLASLEPEPQTTITRFDRHLCHAQVALAAGDPATAAAHRDEARSLALSSGLIAVVSTRRRLAALDAALSPTRRIRPSTVPPAA